MTKYFLCIILIAFTCFCGYVLAKRFRQKKNFYMQFVVFNERFISELSYFRRPLHEFIRSNAYKGEFLLFLNEFLASNDKNNTVLQEIVNDSSFYFLSSDEKAVITTYFSMLGKGDSHSQKAYFSSVKDVLKKTENQAIENCKKYSDLYIKLGFLFGLFIVILII